MSNRTDTEARLRAEVFRPEVPDAIVLHVVDVLHYAEPTAYRAKAVRFFARLRKFLNLRIDSNKE